MKSNNAVGYIRVSTHEQTEGWSLETQESEIRAYAQQHGLTLIEVYQDESSGGTDERPGFEKMIMDAYDGTFSTILIMNTSRMFRNFMLAGMYKNWLRKERDIEVIFINQPTTHLDEATAFLIESISDLFNEYHLQQLRMWTRAGKRARAISGSWNGRIPFGYVANSKGEAVIDLHSRNGVILVFLKYSTGRFSLEEIASLLNEKGYRTLGLKGSRLFTEEAVGDILENFFYIGFVRYKNDLFAGKHTPIIEPELFMKCQSVRAHRAKHAKAYGGNSTIFILAGIAHCNRCGQTLWGQALSIKKKEYRYYRHIHQTGVDICPLQKHGIKAEKLEAAWGVIISEITIPKTWLTRIKIYLSNPQRFAQVMDVKSSDDLKEKRRRLSILFRSKSIDNAEYIKFDKRLRLQEEALTISSNLNLLIDLDLAQHHLQTMAFPWNSTSDYHKQLLAKIMLLDVSIDLISETICKITPYDAFQVLFENTNLQSNNG